MKWASGIMCCVLGACSVSFAEDFSVETYSDTSVMLPNLDLSAMPVVITATRIQQHPSEVPASVTVLDSDFITSLGVNNLAEILRYVPGIMLGPDKGNNIDSLNYHGGESSLPKNLQVLVDGRSMYRSGLASVSWYEMPVAIKDIDRIEVVRGPNAASYGINAYQAVVNILTKHPADTYGNSVSVESGEYGQNDVYLKQGDRIGALDYRLSYTQKSHDGFDNVNDTRESTFLNFDGNQELASYGELNVSFVLADAQRELIDPLPFQMDIREVSERRKELAAKWTTDLNSQHQLYVKVYGTYFQQNQMANLKDIPVLYLDQDLLALYQLNPEAADAIALGGDPVTFISSQEELALATAINDRYPGATGLTPVYGSIRANLDEYRVDLEIQDTYIYSPNLTFVSGASLRRDSVVSDHYFNGELSSNTARFFGSASLSTHQKLNWHFGFMFEKEASTDWVFAPRAALNLQVSPGKSFRYVYSESIRSADFFQQYANWRFDVEGATSNSDLNGTTFYQVAKGPGELGHQKIVSNELGYYGYFNDDAFEVDVRIFQERQSNVLYQTLTVDDFAADTGNTIEHSGIEWQLEYRPFDMTRLRLTGAFVEVDTSQQDNGSKLRIYAKETGTLSWLQNWRSDVSSTLNYFIVKDLDDTNPSTDRYRIERLDGRLLKRFSVSGVDAEVYLNVQHDLASSIYLWDVTQYTDDTRVVFGATFDF